MQRTYYGRKGCVKNDIQKGVCNSGKIDREEWKNKWHLTGDKGTHEYDECVYYKCFFPKSETPPQQYKDDVFSKFKILECNRSDAGLHAALTPALHHTLRHSVTSLLTISLLCDYLGFLM